MRHLSQLRGYYREHWKLFIPGLIAAVLSAVFSLVVPIAVREAIDAIPILMAEADQEGFVLRDAQTWQRLIQMAYWVVGLTAVSGVFHFLMRYLIVVASRRIEFDLRNRLYSHLQTLSAAFFVRQRTGDLMARSTSDIEHVRRYIGPALMYITRATVSVVVAVTIMLLISPRLTMWALLPMPALAISVFYLARQVQLRSDARQKQVARVTSHVQEAFAGIRVSKAYGREAHQADQFEIESAAYRDKSLALAKVEAAWRPIFVALIGLSTILVIWVGGGLVMDGSITVGNIAEYVIYVARMTWPVASMGYVISMMQQAETSMGRLQGVLDRVPAVKDGTRTRPSAHVSAGAIRFEGVSFRHPEQTQDAVTDASFTVGAGERLVIVGRTGAGKSSLIELIPRLHEVSSGRIFIDDQPIESIPVVSLRQSIGFVPQDGFLFSDTLENNARFGRHDATEEEVIEVLKDAALWSSVSEFPDGLQTVLGERGITLSGGQKQRLSIARALLCRPKILLLDDAMSAVDAETEQHILTGLARYGTITTIVVTHRLAICPSADKILVMDEGRIVAQGTHTALMEEDGLYAQLFSQQQLEREIEALT